MIKLTFDTSLDEKQNKALRDEFSRNVGYKLRELRKRSGLTQQKLAERASLHLTYVSHLELGKYHPTVFVMWKISKALGVTLNDLTDF